MTMKKCEACKSNEIQWNLVDNYNKQIKYNVCCNCINELINISLSKTQFNNLLNSGHTTKEFLLHDDFYDEDGNALQGR